MFSNVARGSYLDERISKNYGTEVLLANWQERRLGAAVRTNCILPGLGTVDGCSKDSTENEDNFMRPWKMNEADEATRHYRSARNEAMNNHKRNRETQLRFPLTVEMSNNYTSTYTVMYEIVPKELPHKVDLLQSYGNRSVTSKRCQRRDELITEKAQRLQTNYAADYDLAAMVFKTQPALREA